MLLAFFHAIRDKDPKANNDPQKQHEEWTNYCGTAMMAEDVSGCCIWCALPTDLAAN